MSFLRTAVLAVGMMGLVACGGSSDSGSTTPAADTTNPCGDTEMNPCGEDTEMNPCGEENPCGENPCGEEANPCGEEANPCGEGEDMPCGEE